MAFSHVQGVHNGTGSAIVSVITATGSVVGAGNTVVGTVSWDSLGGTTLLSVKDDKLNTYTIKDTVVDSVNNQSNASFILGNITNGPNALTATTNSANVNGAFLTIIWDEYSGASAVSDPSDGHTGQKQATPGTGTDAVTSGNVTTTVNGDLIYGGTYNTSTGTLASAGSGFASRTSDTSGAPGITEDKTQTTAGSVASTFTINPSAACVTFIIAIKPSSGVAQAPFTNNNWSNATRTNWYLSWEETGNVRLPFPTPFRPLDQSLPVLGQRLQDYTWIQRSLLISTASPFYQTDWPLPGQIQQPIQTWVFFSERLVNLTNPKPFNQSDYPNSLPIKWYQDYEENLLQYTLLPIIVNPFRQQDWPNPPTVNWFQFWYNNLAQLLLPPFSQHEWSLTKAQQPIDQSWFQNLLETTLLVPTPFVQRDWPNPRIPQQPILIWTNGLPPGVINIHGVPFVQSDWPLPKTNQPIDQYWYTDTALLPIPTPITEIITGGRQIWEIELDDLTLATHKWHQRLIDAAKPGTTGEDIRAIASKLGKLGGHARAEAMTQKQRTQQASKAALTRWRPK